MKEFALREINRPIGVSEYNLVEILPDKLKDALPSVDEIERDLQNLTISEDYTQSEE